MKILIGILGLGILCGGWALFQQWISRIDSEVGEPHAGRCCSDRLERIKKHDSYH